MVAVLVSKPNAWLGTRDKELCTQQYMHTAYLLELNQRRQAWCVALLHSFSDCVPHLHQFTLGVSKADVVVGEVLSETRGDVKKVSRLQPYVPVDVGQATYEQRQNERGVTST